MKIVTAPGARPHFINVDVLGRAWRGYPEIEGLIVHMSQHLDANMSYVFFEEMEIKKPGYHLYINGLRPDAMEKIEALLKQNKEVILN